MIAGITEQYGIDAESCAITAFGSGLINHTWKIDCGIEAYILQRINTNVFKKPFAIAENIEAVGNFLHSNYPDYLFVKPLPARNGNAVVENKDGFFRLMPFVKNSVTYNVAEDTSTAFEAAKQFGRFTKFLAGFNPHTLQVTLPDFHNLPLRYQQFVASLSNASPERLNKSSVLIDKAKQYENIVTHYEALLKDTGFTVRITHHDTKISNVLFDAAGNGLCVIDLDTLMPGYFVSDLGDMLRTYISPVSEEEQHLEKITVRNDYVEAVMKGYLQEMKGELTTIEKENLLYAGKFMIYMQALRFLTDYLNNDVYYKPAYPLHNFSRAANQFVLLEKLMEKEEVLQSAVNNLLQH